MIRLVALPVMLNLAGYIDRRASGAIILDLRALWVMPLLGTVLDWAGLGWTGLDWAGMG